MPESKRDFRMSYVSVWRTRLVRATAMRSCAVRRLTYCTPIWVVSSTEASATDHPAAWASAMFASVWRRLPPKMSISHWPSSVTLVVL